MSGYYDGYDGIPDYGGPRHEGRDHRIVDTKDVVANDWVGHAYDPAGDPRLLGPPLRQLCLQAGQVGIGMGMGMGMGQGFG